MSELQDFAIEIESNYDEVYRRILDDCESPQNVLIAFKQQFSRYASNQNPKRFTCRQSGDVWTIDKPISYRNSFALQMNLEFAARGDATRIICRFRTHILVKLFMLVFSAPLLLISVLATGGFIAGVVGGTKTIGDITGLAAIPLFGGFLTALYFGGRKISEPNAIEMKNWLLGLFPYRNANIEK